MLATWGTSTGFNPASLFAGGVQGAWYDPSDNTTMFQDSAGTTPVTAVEQAVGLILDKSKGLVLGPELVTNGTFDTSTTGWSITSSSVTTSVSAIGVTLTNVSANGGISQSISGLIVGRTYRFSANVTAGTTNGIIQVGDNVNEGQSLQFTGASGQISAVFVAGSTSRVVSLRVNSASVGATCSFDNISVRELPGNHAIQPTSASRPTLRARYNLLTFSEQFDNAAWLKIGVSVSQNAATAPDGTSTADKLIEDSSSGTHSANATFSFSVATYVVSSYFKAAERTQAFIRIGGTVNLNFIYNLSNGTVVSGAGATIESVGDGWYRCAATFAITGAVSTGIGYGPAVAGSISYAGDNASGVFAWGAQLTNPAVFPSNVYQRIAAATDYATGAAFPQYLAFDGTDDSLYTGGNVDFATVTSDGQARRNLLLNPTQFDAAGWTTQNATVTANNATAPDNTTTAELVTATGTSPTATVISSAVTVTPSTTYTYSVYLKAGTATTVRLRLSDVTTGQAQADINLSTGATSIFAAGPYGSPSVSAVSVGSGWWRVSLTGTQPAGQTSAACGIYLLNNGETTLIWGAQLEIGSTATAFQNIGTDKMTVWAGVTKLSDAATAILAELSATSASNSGTFAIFAPSSVGGADFYWRSVGTAQGNVNAVGNSSPITRVLTGIGNIADDVATIRVNGAATTSTDNQGTGNFGNYPLFIGRRNNANLPLNGRIYSLIVRGAASNSTQIEQTERYVASKTPLGVVP